MKTARATSLAAAFLLGGVMAGHWAFGNGGPFVVKYPSGDPAAKGVLARLDPTLKPARESRLRVVKEDLTVRFGADRRVHSPVAMPPRVEVTAAYTIENPTGEEVQVDFGFPILRGIYLNPFTMVPTPDVQVRLDKGYVRPTVISNSAIYGMIRQNAREAIEKGIAADGELARRTAAVRAAWAAARPAAPAQQPVAQQAASPAPAERTPTADYLPARENLRSYLTATLQWNQRDAALLVEYVSLQFAANKNVWVGGPRDRWDPDRYWNPSETDKLKLANLGPLAAIGEQKATQLFAQLASQFDKDAGAKYEAIFAAWGGDVRERSIDLGTGRVRPRELDLPAPKPIARNARELPPEAYDRRLTADPTVYARVDYLDPNAKITAEEKASCEAILKNLPVVFTFAPMNLLHYQAKFPAGETRVVTVSYSQYAYADTHGSGSYQLAYVLHPATLWNEFGPIHLAVYVPEGIACKASAAIEKEDNRNESQVQQVAQQPAANAAPGRRVEPVMEVYKVTLQERQEKQGELFIAIDKTAWDKAFPPSKPKPIAQRQ